MLHAAYVRGSTGQSSNSTLVVTVSPRLKISLVREIHARAHCARSLFLRAFLRASSLLPPSSASFIPFIREGRRRSLDQSSAQKKGGKNLSDTNSSLSPQNFTLYKFVRGVNLAFHLDPLDTVTLSPARPRAGEARLYGPSGSMLVKWAFCIHRARAGPCQVPPRPGKSLSGTIEEGDWRESVCRGSFKHTPSTPPDVGERYATPPYLLVPKGRRPRSAGRRRAPLGPYPDSYPLR